MHWSSKPCTAQCAECRSRRSRQLLPHRTKGFDDVAAAVLRLHGGGAAVGQLALEADLHVALVALVRPGVPVKSLGVPAVPSDVEAAAAATAAMPLPVGLRRREERERVLV